MKPTYQLLSRRSVDSSQNGPVQIFELSMLIGTNKITNLLTNWSNLYLEVSGPLHPYQLNWRNMDLEGTTPENPVTISENQKDGESANTQAPNQDGEEPDDRNYTAPVLLVRDGCYRK